MMKHEFEALAGYEVTTETYNNIVEPMYMATNLTKQEFVKLLNRKALEYKPERKPNVKAMLVRDRSGYRKTPNRCYYHVQYVDMIDVDIKTRKYVVEPLSDEAIRELRLKGTDLNLGYRYDFDYTQCVDRKHKPVELSFGW